MPGYIIASQNSTLRSSGLCQATSSRGTAAFSATPAYARLHHREAQQHSQQPRPMPSYIIARHSIILSKTGLCQATSSRGTAASSATPAYARLHHRKAQLLSQQPQPMPGYIIARHSSTFINPGACQATLSRSTAASLKAWCVTTLPLPSAPSPSSANFHDPPLLPSFPTRLPRPIPSRCAVQCFLLYFPKLSGPVCAL